jgi:hypothetical protein
MHLSNSFFVKGENENKSEFIINVLLPSYRPVRCGPLPLRPKPHSHRKLLLCALKVEVPEGRQAILYLRLFINKHNGSKDPARLTRKVETDN